MEGKVYTVECIAEMFVLSSAHKKKKVSIVPMAGYCLYSQNCRPFSGYNRKWLVTLVSFSGYNRKWLLAPIVIVNSLPWYHFAISDLQVQGT